MSFWGCLGLDGADVADFVDEGADDLGTVGMLLAVGFDSIAQEGVAGVDEQGKHHVGVGECHGGYAGCIVGGNGLCSRGVGARCVSVGEPLQQLGAVLLAGLVLREEGGTDEHQGGEPATVIVFVYLDVGIGIEPTETDDILELLFGRAFCEPMAEDDGYFPFEVVDEVAADELLGVVVGIADVAVVKVVEGDALRASEEVEGDADADAVLAEPDALDDARMILPVLYAKQHFAADFHLPHGGCGHAKENFQLTIIYNVPQLLKLLVGNGYLQTCLAAVVDEALAGERVPVGRHEFLYSPLGCTDEDEVLEDVAYLVGDVGTHI